MSEYIKSLTAEDDSTYLIKENPAIHYGICSTAAATVAKTVDIDGFKLDTGSWIAIKFTVTNTGAVGSLTLNVNNTGAYSIKYRNGNLDDKGYLAANRIYLFLFDGTYWQIVGDIDAGHPATVKSTDTTSTASPGHGGTFTAVDSVTRDDFGHVTKINTKTVTLPSDSDENVKQTPTTSSNTAFRPIIIGADSTSTPHSYTDTGTEKTDKVYAAHRVFITPSTGDVSLCSASGAATSPSVIFRRGTMIDGELDWRIRDNTGRLEFDRNKSGSVETWENILKLDPSGNAMYFKGTAVSLSGHLHSVTVPSSFAVKTGSSTQARITLQTLMTWLITTKAYIPAGAHRKLSLHTTWAYADNDILQFTVDGINYEMTLAGVVIEFDGYASDYQTGVFRLRIHSAPATNSFVLTDGYERFPLSHIAEYYCNGSDYTPIWKMLINRSDIANGTSTTGNGTISVVGKPVSVYGLGTAAYTESTDYVPTSMLTVTKNTTVGITPSSNAFGYVSGLTRAVWNFQQTDGTLLSQYYNEKWQNEIYMDYRTGQMSTRGKNNGTWQDWRIQLDSGNFSSYAVPNTKSGVISAINLLDEATANITSDNAHFISEENNGSTTNYYRRKFSGLWGYINGKISATNTGTGNAVTSISYSNGVITATKGSTFLTTHQTVTDGNPTLEWGTQSTVATIGSTDIHVTMPPNPNTDTKVNVTLATTTKAYLLGTSTTPTSSAQEVTSVADTGVYLGTTAGMLCVNGTICANAGNNTAAGGLSLYGTDPTAYGVMFRGTANSGKHGYVQSDWATYFTMNADGTTRGWVFRRGTTNVGSVSGAGNAVFNGSVTVGGNTTNTSGCRMKYNTTTQSLDFVFV